MMGWTAVAGASTYQNMMLQALMAHDAGRQSIRGQLSEKRIADAVYGFAAPFEALSAAIARARAGQGGKAYA